MSLISVFIKIHHHDRVLLCFRTRCGKSGPKDNTAHFFSNKCSLVFFLSTVDIDKQHMTNHSSHLKKDHLLVTLVR
jgi:hypothetical protein